MKNLTLLVICIFLFSATVKAQKFSETIKTNLEKLVSQGELLPSDINWEISSKHISSISAIHHIYYFQTVNGIKINKTESSIHLLPNGDVLSSHNNFINNSSKKARNNSSPSITAIEAIHKIAKELGYSVTKTLSVLSRENNATQKTLISNGEISVNKIPVQLIYKYEGEGVITLAWQVSILEPNFKHSWVIYVDASTGNIIDKTDLIIYCNQESNSKRNINYNSNLINLIKPESVMNSCEECYEVFGLPLESPYYGDRSVVNTPSHNVASPFGWHDVDGVPGGEYNTTRGNNLNAYIGTSGNDGYQPYGGSLLNFTGYPFDQNFSKDERQEDASITNLFYWGNITHDVLYLYGFTEEAGNFQENNYNRGGLGEDSIFALGQVQLDFCNAYFIPSVDGGRSYLNMNACNSKDGVFDNLVVIHEYIHGLTSRLIREGSGGMCNSDETPFEGWSDWYGLMLTLSPEDVGTRPRGFATYLLNQGENGEGGRLYPYTTDMSINPQTYDFIKNYNSVHNIGSVWASILWEITWALIEEYGYDPDIYNFTGDINQDAGNIIALAIVTEGLKLVNCNSGFVVARDAIFNAFNAIYGGVSNCILWEAFAKRGLGINAYEGSADDTTDGYESFDVPPSTAQFNFELANICSNAPVNTNLGGGLPFGGIYSGIGVIDDDNGLSFSFDPSIAGIGLHLVTYTITENSCTVASTDEGTIEVIEDNLAPEIECTEEMVVTIPFDTDFYTIIDFSFLSYYNDNCSNEVSLTQSPTHGTLVSIGMHIVEFEVKDDAGNMATCSFNLIVEKEVEDIEAAFDVYPNPTNNAIVLASTYEIGSLTTGVFDIYGKLILENEFNDFGFEKNLSLNELANGIYFLKINTVDFSVLKRIIKE